jgi:pyrophosphate--fructose-6-phosphate 1-phosphotransferase
MGNSASHIALECALQSQPNICLISEEVEDKNQTLDDIVEYIVKIIVRRSNQGLDYGTALIPEGLIEFIPTMKRLIAELNDMLANNDDFDELNADDERRAYIKEILQPENCKVFRSLPKDIAKQLTHDRDPHGNIQVSLIETEKLLIEMVGKRLAQMKAAGSYKGKFSALHHFFGYEGRCATPTNFDADYTYSLGETAAVLISEGKTGYLASISNLTKPASEWIAGGVPITMMMNMEQRSGRMKPVIRKALVRLDREPFMFFEKYRDNWAYDISDYIYPGPIQYFGPTEVCNQPPRTLLLEKEYKLFQ